jgi:hypothetical protein
MRRSSWISTADFVFQLPPSIWADGFGSCSVAKQRINRSLGNQKIGLCGAALIPILDVEAITAVFVANVAIYVFIIHFALYLLVREVKSRPDIGSNREKIKVFLYSAVIFAVSFVSIRYVLSWAGVL